MNISNKIRRRQWHPTPVLLPGKSHGQRSLVGCSPWGRQESDTSEQLHFPFSLSYTGEGNGNPLQCSCLENPRDGGAWWATVYGVTQSDTTEVIQHSIASNKINTKSIINTYLLNIPKESPSQPSETTTLTIPLITPLYISVCFTIRRYVFLNNRLFRFGHFGLHL